MRFTTLPFLVMFLIGLGQMPALDIYQINAWNHGTEKTEPWRTKLSTAPGVVRLVALFTRTRDWLADLTNVPLLTSEIGAVGNIKQLIQDEADTKAKITKLKKEGRTLNAIPTTVIAATATTLEVKARTPEQVARFTAVFVELDALDETLEGIQAELVTARRLQDDERGNPTIELGADHATEKPWKSLGEQMQAIAWASGRFDGHRTPDPRLFATISGASSAAPADGGFLIQSDFSTVLMNKIATSGVLAPRCWTIPIGEGSDGLEAPYVNETSRATGSRWGGVQVYRTADGVTPTSSKPGFGKFEQRLEDLRGLFYATDRLLRDATALEAIAMKAFSSEFAFKLDDEIVRGDGAGQCLGLLNAPATVSVAKESGQTAATIKAENVIKMYARMLASKVANSFWAINQECLPQLMQMYVAAGTAGQLVYMPPSGIVTAPYGTLLGRPVVPIEQAAGLGTVGDIMFLSLAEDYILINKPMTSASSMHVRFIFEEMTYRWNYPIVGRPWLQAAITPYKATTATTLSPFITLASR